MTVPIEQCCKVDSGSSDHECFVETSVLLMIMLMRKMKREKNRKRADLHLRESVQAAKAIRSPSSVNLSRSHKGVHCLYRIPLSCLSPVAHRFRCSKDIGGLRRCRQQRPWIIITNPMIWIPYTTYRGRHFRNTHLLSCRASKQRLHPQ